MSRLSGKTFITAEDSKAFNSMYESATSKLGETAKNLQDTTKATNERIKFLQNRERELMLQNDELDTQEHELYAFKQQQLRIQAELKQQNSNKLQILQQKLIRLAQATDETAAAAALRQYTEQRCREYERFADFCCEVAVVARGVIRPQAQVQSEQEQLLALLDFFANCKLQLESIFERLRREEQNAIKDTEALGQKIDELSTLNMVSRHRAVNAMKQLEMEIIDISQQIKQLELKQQQEVAEEIHQKQALHHRTIELSHVTTAVEHLLERISYKFDEKHHTAAQRAQYQAMLGGEYEDAAKLAKNCKEHGITGDAAFKEVLGSDMDGHIRSLYALREYVKEEEQIVVRAVEQQQAKK